MIRWRICSTTFERKWTQSLVSISFIDSALLRTEPSQLYNAIANYLSVEERKSNVLELMKLLDSSESQLFCFSALPCFIMLRRILISEAICQASHAIARSEAGGYGAYARSQPETSRSFSVWICFSCVSPQKVQQSHLQSLCVFCNGTSCEVRSLPTWMQIFHPCLIW